MDRKIRLAFIGLNKFPIPAIKGGAIERGVTRTLNINEHLQRYDITVFTIKDPDLDEEAKKYKHSRIVQINEGGILGFVLSLYRIARKLSGYRLPLKTTYMTRINRYLIKENYDVVHFATSNTQVAELSDKVKSKVIYGVASDYLTMQSYGIQKIIKRVDRYTGGPYLMERMMSMLGLPEEKFLKSTFAIDSNIDDETTRLKYRQEIRQKHNISEDDIVLLYVGRLSPGKGALQLIQSVKDISNVCLIVVGGENFSSNEETTYVKSLKEEASQCKGRVIFTGYVEKHSDVRKYMYAADIASVPSICNEAGSIALLEFRVASLPTVISDKGGMKYHAGENTITVACDDHYVSNLETAIKRLCDDPAYRCQLASRARIGLEGHTPEALYEVRYKQIKEMLQD